MPVINDIAVTAETSAQKPEAELLAQRLHLPLAEPSTTDYSLLLVVTGARLEVRQTKQPSPGPVWVDFIGGKADYRRRCGGGRKEALVRAIGVKGKNPPTVLDATAGLGQDSFVLACQGCKVKMMERNPVVASLLADGLRRAGDDPSLGAILRERLALIEGNSLAKMAELVDNQRPEVVYLDPMYPHRSKSALVKKEMRILRKLVGNDEDSGDLLPAALKVAGRRVVVKRPAYAPPLPGPKPNLALATKNHRFDIYLI